MKNKKTKVIIFTISCMIAICALHFHSFNLGGRTKDDEGQEEIIEWKDPALEAAVKYMLLIPQEQDITIKEAATYQVAIMSGENGMVLEGEDIKNLEGLQYFTNMGSIILRGTSVSDLSMILPIFVKYCNLSSGNNEWRKWHGFGGRGYKRPGRFAVFYKYGKYHT